MKSILMAIMAVAVAVTFSAPAFAGEEKKKEEKKGGHVVVYGDEKKDKKARAKAKALAMPVRHTMISSPPVSKVVTDGERKSLV